MEANDSAESYAEPESDRFPSLSSSQLQELRGVIAKPISGRNVMIPLTSKAFVIGSLQPVKNADGDEAVQVRHEFGGQLRAVLRKDVCEELENEKQRRKDAAKASKRKKSTETETPVTNSTTNPSNVNNNQHQPPPSVITDSDTGLPYFEIKEEIDGTGKVVRSEAVNVTKQLEFVAKRVAENESNLGESKVDSTGDNATSNDGVFSKEEMEMLPEKDESARALPNDEEYKAISARLDELARMEEETEAKLSENKLSALKLQSKGWSKGFLGGGGKKKSHQTAVNRAVNAKTTEPTKNDQSEPRKQLTEEPPKEELSQPSQGKAEPQNKTNKKDLTIVETSAISNNKRDRSQSQLKPPPPSKPKATTKDKGGWSKGFLNNSNKSKPSAKGSTAAKKMPPPTKSTDSADGHVSQADSKEERSKKVHFQSNVSEVREIPRIGTNSVASLRKPPPTTSAPPRAESRPFDSSVFSGVVKERPITGLQNPQSNGKEEGKPKKKLSKFAQQRMQNNR
ncbi:expressed unknown protein [Seminavis robusta]|uniref:Uncharacterized protein n=1 Tax=Seminavis robusta TaxID=568900 RepID=A0A9N8HKU2_9STRA|nr:expressed unknown protein [Seminavis robusta]|eukprot:Sro865_g212790.1 n/a (511) ;mRNA; r:10854-12386